MSYKSDFYNSWEIIDPKQLPENTFWKIEIRSEASRGMPVHHNKIGLHYDR